MTLTEPSTLITDYVLGVLAAVLAVRLLYTGRREGQRAVQLWGAGFIAIALGAFAGGSYHGLGAVLSAQAHNLLWKVAVFAVGPVSALLLAGAVTATFTARLRKVLLGLILVKLAAYSLWMGWHDEFRYAIYDQAISLLVVLVAGIFVFLRMP